MALKPTSDVDQTRISELGQTRKSARSDGMSVLPSTADVVGPPRRVGFVPKAEGGGLI